MSGRFKMFGRFKGYKTIAVGGFLVAYAVAAMAGIEVPTPDGEEAMGLTGALMLILRFVTNGPAGGSK